MDNLLQRRITELTCAFAQNFVIQDITDKSIAIVKGMQRDCKQLFVIFGLIVNSDWARVIHNDNLINRYLDANKLAWYYSVDADSHITLIYVVEKGKEKFI